MPPCVDLVKTELSHVNGKNMHVRSTRCLYNALYGIGLDDDTILAELLLNENNLLGALHDEVPAGIERTFRHAGQVRVRTIGQDAFTAPQHDGEAPDSGIPLHNVLSAGVHYRDHDRRTVRDVA